MAVWTYQQIITEADTLVPNASGIDDKCGWLNEVNAMFFEVVLIPQAVKFTTVPASPTVSLSAAATPLKARKVDRVIVGTVKYLDFLHRDVPPGQSYFTIDDSGATSTITLTPNPPTAQQSIIRYFKVAGSPITASNYAATAMDAPGEYGWIYVLGLAERIAKAIPDVALANNYAADFQRQLLIAKQSFQNAMPQQG